MRAFWVYDWEVYKNFACVTFIHTTTPKVYIDAYIKLDIEYLQVRNKLELNLRTDDWNELTELDIKFNELKNKKAKLLTVMNAKTFFIFHNPDDTTKNICQLAELIMFFRNHKVLMGYNSYNYDSIITDYILCQGHKYNNQTGKNLNNIHILQELKRVSDSLINMSKEVRYQFKHDWMPNNYRRMFEDYDIQKILYLDKTFVGLKSVAINLRWHRIQELPIHFDKIIEVNDVHTIYDYNVNDVLITLSLTMNQQEEIEIREGTSEHYDINILNESRSSIGKRLMTKYYCEEAECEYKDFKDLRTIRHNMKLSDIISDTIYFKTDKFKELLTELKSKVISSGDDFSKVFDFNGTFYTIGKGGIHSIDDSRIYDMYKDKCLYRDADVTSYYPSILEIFKIAPAHLNKDIFLKLISFFKNDRVAAKREGRKLEAEALKIVINRIYGALSDFYDYLFDPKATYETTLNGQLSLLMLIESLETNGIHVISANTDGIVSKIEYHQEELYQKLCKDWEKLTKFELEYTDYEKYVRSNVNNYIAIKKGFSESLNQEKDAKKYVKGKGSYIFETPFNKGFNHPIVAKALYDYLVFNKDYKETIFNYWKTNPFAIYDYCMSQKVAKSYDVKFNSVVNGEVIKQDIQQYNRFYITTKGGGAIVKEDVYKKSTTKSNTDIPLSKRPSGSHKANLARTKAANIHTVNRSQSLVAGEKLALFNDYILADEYNIDYSFYIHKVESFLFYRKKSSKGNHRNEGIEVRNIDLFNQ